MVLRFHPRSSSGVALLLASAYAGHAALAQSPPATYSTLTPVVVSGARFEQQLPETLPATQVITRDEIVRSQVPDALALIRRLAGVEVAQTGGIGAQAGIFMRGGSGRSTLVLVDGVPINNLNFSSAALEQIVASQIDRIEVVTGSVGALYGAQATGGVIQIFTRNGGGKPRVEAALGVGSRDTVNGNAALLGSYDALRYGLNIAGYKTAGFDSTDKDKRPVTNPDKDGYRNTSASANLAYAIAGGHEVGARWTKSLATIDYDSEFGPPTQRDRSSQSLTVGSIFAKAKLAEPWVARLSVARADDKLDADITAFPYFVRSTGTQYVWDNTIVLAQGWTATAALERLRQKIDSNTTYARDSRSVNTVRAGINGRVGTSTIQVNARNDDTSDYGRRTTWYAGYGLEFAPGWRASTSASTGFNAPSFNDLFFPFGGNPNLKPETSKSYEAALQYAAGDTFARATLFSTRYRDLIGFDSSFNAINIGRAKVEGIEASAGTSVDGWRVKATATAQNAKDQDLNLRLARRARVFGNLTVDRTFGPVDIEANWRMAGNRRDRAIGQERELATYGVVDLAARWAVDRDWSISTRIENLFDRRYENVYGYRANPLGVFASVRYTLR